MTGRETTSVALLGALGVILTVHFFDGEANGEGGTARVKRYVDFLLTGRGADRTSWFHRQHDATSAAANPSSSDGGVIGEGSTIDSWMGSLGFFGLQVQEAAAVERKRVPPRRRPQRRAPLPNSQTSTGGTVIANP